MAHLHVLIGAYLDQRWISEAWAGVGGGKIVDIRMVDIHRIKHYLAKYLTKDFFLSVPSKKKRVSTSRNIRLFEKRSASGWKWSRRPIGTLHWIYRTCGRTLPGDELLDRDGNLRVFATRDHKISDPLRLVLSPESPGG